MATYLGSRAVGIPVLIENPTTDFDIWKTMDLTNSLLNGTNLFTDAEYEKAFVVYKKLANIILGGIDG